MYLLIIGEILKLKRVYLGLLPWLVQDQIGIGLNCHAHIYQNDVDCLNLRTVLAFTYTYILMLLFHAGFGHVEDEGA